jgi:hypothetical protein
MLAQRWADQVSPSHTCFAQVVNSGKQAVRVPALGSLIEGVGPFSIKPNARSPLYPVSEQAFELLSLASVRPAEVESCDAFVWGGARKVVVWQA